LKRVFQAALEVPRENHETYLRAACTDDDLRREVAALLESDADSTEFLSDPAVTYLPLDPQRSVERHIGPFRIVREIGAGGMGTVYLAERESDFRQRVAVKLIRADVASGENHTALHHRAPDTGRAPSSADRPADRRRRHRGGPAVPGGRLRRRHTHR